MVNNEKGLKLINFLLFENIKKLEYIDLSYNNGFNRDVLLNLY